MGNIHQLSSQRRSNKFDFYLICLILVLAFAYLIGLLNPSSFDRLHTFNSKTIADTAQVARNTIRGDFFVTKYILPVGYIFNPIIEGHPDFIRYPFQVILYSLLFFMFSPDPITINLFSGFLFVINGIVMYRLFLQMGNNENSVDGAFDRKENRLPPFLASLFTSLCVTQYYVGIYTGLQEIIAYCIVLLFILSILSNPDKPFLIGLFAGLIYLARPNMVLVVPIFFAPFLFFQYQQKQFWRTAIWCAVGILIVVFPFIFRSYVYTGELTFGLQHKIDLIKGLEEFPHDELYHTFSFPPSVASVILNNKAAYFQRWLHAASFALRIIFNLDYWIAWIGIIPFVKLHKKYAWIIFAYLGFICCHILIASNYLFIPTDAIRIYIPIMTLLTAFGFYGLLTMFANLSVSKENSHRWVLSAGIVLVVSLAVFQYTQNLAQLPQKESLGAESSISIFEFLKNFPVYQEEFKQNQPSPAVEAIKAMNLPCVYTNDPYWSSWNIDIPSIYRTEDLNEMLTKGPKECDHFLWYVPLKNGREKIAGFLEANATLVYGSEMSNVKLYKFKGK